MGDTGVTTPDGPRRRGRAGTVDADPGRDHRLGMSGRERRARAPRAPRFWFELALIAVGYTLYSAVRNAVPERRKQALDHGRGLWDLEQRLHTGFELATNQALDRIDWLIVGMNYYYATLHFVVTIGVLLWLYVRHPGRYRAARSVLVVTTFAALLGYWLYPLAPPRLLPGEGFIDTVLTHGTWGSMASGDLESVSNQYAAMPSMHIGWALWCGIALSTLAASRPARLLGASYPLVTLVVIVATANHFWLDAVGGILCLALGSAVVLAWYGALPHRMPRRAGRNPGAAPRTAGGAGGTEGAGAGKPGSDDNDPDGSATRAA